MRRLSTVLIFSIAFSVSLVAALEALARRDRSRDHYDLAAEDSELPALLAAHGYTPDALDVGGGVQLRGMLRAPASDHSRVVLFFPGNTEPQLRSSLPALEAIRAGRDFGMAAWAYRGFDGSNGTPSAERADADAQRALAAVHDRLGAESERTVVMGYSLGSGIALRLAAAMSRAGHPPAAVVLLSPFWKHPVGPAKPLGYFLPSDVYRVEDVVRDIKVPVLIVAGAKDQELPVEQHARRLAAALPTSTYWELRGHGHVDFLGDPSLLARIGGFF